MENTGMAKMKGAELPNPAQGGARMRSCCIKLETNQPNTKLVCISAPITGRSTSLFSSKTPVECFSKISTWPSPTLP